jgi:S1-C subfamily serine protease
VNLLDLVIIAAVLAALAHGILLGAAIQVTSFVGFGIGLAAGAWLAPVVAHYAHTAQSQAVISLAVVFGMASLVGGLGRSVGTSVWRAARRFNLGAVDSFLGALVAGASTLLAAWLIGSMLARVPNLGLGPAIQQSKILRALDGRLPPAPSVFARIGGIVQPRNLPDVFAQLEPRPAEPVAPPADPTVRAILAKDQASVVKVQGPACGAVAEGSGFVAAPGLVVTNAHVVAGMSRPAIFDSRGEHSATVVVFDPNLDIAVLRAGGLAGAPLTLLAQTFGRGTSGAVMGYPLGGPLKAVPGAVLRQMDAEGRDIYGRNLTTRSIYELQADVEHGNSGGPIARSDGAVFGVVFAKSTSENGIGYALTSDEVVPKVKEAQSQSAAADTGPCAA